MEKISRERYGQLKKSLWKIYNCDYSAADNRDRVDMYAEVALEALNIEVEDPPILPDVTPGKWEAIPSTYTAGSVHILSSDKHVASLYGDEQAFCPRHSDKSHPSESEAIANGKVMAASTELVEILYALTEWATGSEHLKEGDTLIEDAINILDKAGVDVEKWR